MNMQNMNPIFFVFIFILTGFSCYFFNLTFSDLIWLINELFLVQHILKVSNMLSSIILFVFKLLNKFFINFCRSISLFVNTSSFFNENFQLFFQMGKLFLEVKLSLIINNFIAFDFFSKHLTDFFIPLSLIQLIFNSSELVLHGFDFTWSLSFISQEFIFCCCVFEFFFFKHIDFGFDLKFLFVNIIMFFSDCC